MKRLCMLAALLSVPGICMAQESGEIVGFYQRVQGFDVDAFGIKGASTNGGGYCFLYNLSPKFGLFQQMSFFGGVELEPGLKLRMISETQGLRITKETGPIAFYAKGGVGFNHYVFSVSGYSGQSVYYGMALDYGGGTEIRMSEGMFLVLEAAYKSAGLPSGLGWDTQLHIMTGIAFHF